RGEGGWGWVGGGLAVFHFATPFALLLSRDVKPHPRRLLAVALLVGVMSAVHQFWLVAPVFSPRRLFVHWMDLAALVGVGGLWVAGFLWQLEARPLLPGPHPGRPTVVARCGQHAAPRRPAGPPA